VGMGGVEVEDGRPDAAEKRGQAQDAEGIHLVPGVDPHGLEARCTGPAEDLAPGGSHQHGPMAPAAQALEEIEGLLLPAAPGALRVDVDRTDGTVHEPPQDRSPRAAAP
jgi:hypothetical protein